MRRAKPNARRARQTGRTLLETMIALAIGAVLTGVVLSTVSGSGPSGRRLDAQATLNENGQVAVELLAGPLRMAGFWQPDSEVATIDAPADAQPMLRGCSGGFADAAAAWASLACAPGDSDAVAVRYQAGEAGTSMAMDCGGTDVRAAGREMIEDRYFIRTQGTETGNPALFCQPTTGGTAILLVDDVERMTLRYGISPVAANPVSNRAFDAAQIEGRTMRYLPAQSLVADCTAGAVPADSWCAVTAVTLCLQLRTADDTAIAAATPFVDCNGQLRTVDDRRLRRAMSTTISLRNRTAVPLQGPQ